MRLPPFFAQRICRGAWAAVLPNVSRLSVRPSLEATHRSLPVRKATLSPSGEMQTVRAGTAAAQQPVHDPGERPEDEQRRSHHQGDDRDYDHDQKCC